MTAPQGRAHRGTGMSSAARGAALVGLAVILGIVGLQILDDSSSGGGTAPETSLAATSTTLAGTPSTVAAGIAHPPAEVKVKVLNASGVTGVATTMSDKLKGLGYNMLEAANVKGTRSGNVIQCKDGFAADGEAIKASTALSGAATVERFPSSPPEGSADADCLVVLGTAS